jgi:hypothetical protein
MAQPQQGDDGEIIVHHKGRPIAPHRAGIRWGHKPELGVHLHGPQMLAASDAASVALFAVHAYSWGLEVEVKAARKSWEVRDLAYDPITDDGFRLGFAVSKQDMVLHGLPPGPHDESAAVGWHLASGSGGSRQPGFESSAHFKIAVEPYPSGGVLWVAWAWPEQGLAEDARAIALPAPGSFISIPMMGDIAT